MAKAKPENRLIYLFYTIYHFVSADSLTNWIVGYAKKNVLVHVYLVLLRMRRFFVMVETRIPILNTKLVFVIVLQTAHILKHFVMVQCTV